MANKWITWVLEEAPLDDPSEVLLMLVLADSSNPDGVCWPSKKTIAQYMRMSPRNVARLTACLEDKTLIEKKYRARDTDKGQTSNFYQLYRRTREEVIEAYENAKQRREQDRLLKEGVTLSSSPHDTLVIPPMTSGSPQGVTLSSYQEPIVEPSVKPKEKQLLASVDAGVSKSSDWTVADEADEYQHLPLGKQQISKRAEKAKAKLQQPTTPPPGSARPSPKVTPAGALADALGLKIVNGDGAKFGKVATALNKAGITCEEFDGYIVYWREMAKRQNWTLGLHALTGGVRMSEYVAWRDSNPGYARWLTNVVPVVLGRVKQDIEPAADVTPESSEATAAALEQFLSTFGGQK